MSEARGQLGKGENIKIGQKWGKWTVLGKKLIVQVP